MPDVSRVQVASLEVPVKCILPHGLSSGGYVPQASFTDYAWNNASIGAATPQLILAAPIAGTSYSLYRLFLTLDPTGVAFPVRIDWSWGVGTIFATTFFTASVNSSVFDFSPFGVRMQPVSNVALYLLNQAAVALHLYWTVLYSLEV